MAGDKAKAIRLKKRADADDEEQDRQPHRAKTAPGAPAFVRAGFGGGRG